MIRDAGLTIVGYVENLTNEQYQGVVPRQVNALSVSRDTLNPLLNTQVLKNRLAAIEYYNMQHGSLYARWPKHFMAQTAAKLWKYKVNLAVKGAAGYMLYREVQQYRNLSEKTIMTFQQSFGSFGSIGAHTALFIGVCGLL